MLSKRCFYFRAGMMVVCLICMGILPLPAAQPDAGGLLNQQRQVQPPLKRPPTVVDQQKEQMPAAHAGLKVTIKDLRFSGIEGIATEAELNNLLADATGKEMGFEDLQALAARVTRYLREEKGYLLARAYLPKQDITGGIVEIAVIAGRIEGQSRIEIKGPSRINPELLKEIAGRAIPDGQAARLGDIERGVLLMNDLPGISARAALEPGETAGTSRLIITATEGLGASALFGLDNHGDRYTGVRRTTTQLGFQDPSGWGDQLSLGLVQARNLYQARGAYSLPLWDTGLNWSLYFSHMGYRIGSGLESLEARGKARTAGTSLGYPLLRTRAASLWTTLGYEHLALNDKVLGATTARRLPVGNAGLMGSFFDNFGGGGISSLACTLYRGDLNIAPSQTRDMDQTGPRKAGGFLRATYSAARLQRLSNDFSLYAMLRGQFAAGNLDSSQKFILGGPGGVRAYPVGEASADQGHVLTGEVRYDLPFSPSWARTQLAGFVDTGAVTLHKRVWPGALTNATGSNRYSLSGGGVGFNVSKPGLYNLRLAYAHRIGGNDGRNGDDTNTDNHRDHGQFWLQALAWF